MFGLARKGWGKKKAGEGLVVQGKGKGEMQLGTIKMFKRVWRPESNTCPQKNGAVKVVGGQRGVGRSESV